VRIKAACHTFGAHRSNKECWKTLVTSEGWLCSAEFVGLAPRGEVKERISLVNGHIPDAILKVERERCPGAVSQIAFGRFGNSPGRPNAGLPGAGCPGSGSVVRYHEARDRTEPRPKALARAAVERREASASPKRGARRDERNEQAATLVGGPAESTLRLSALRLPSPRVFLAVACRKARGANKKAQRENGNLFFPHPRRTRLHCFPCPLAGAKRTLEARGLGSE
jgi:hypothetical protein